jgi:cell division transport system ATP-binding protein
LILVVLEDLSLSYGEVPVLRQLNLRLAPASFHFLLGSSGAGKSSLLRLLYLSALPTGGRLMLFGRDVQGLPRSERARLRRRIGVVFQDFRLLNHLSVFENVMLPLHIAGAANAEEAAKVRELLKWVGLSNEIEAMPETLSGGQQQRVAIARAVISRPSLLLADEPTGNLDDGLAMRLLFLFEELHRAGTTVLIATHNDALVKRFKQPVLRLEAGRIKREAALPSPPKALAT